MRVLVSGSTGFLGRYTVELLLKNGFEVVGLDCRESLVPISHTSYRELICDIRDYEAIIRAGAPGVDAVIHLAAIPSIAKSSFETYESINVGGTSNIVRAAKQLGARTVVYTSSSTVYGMPSRCPISEDFETPPIGRYGATKLAAERLVLDLNQRDNATRGIVIRPRVVMGPGRMGIFDILFNAVYRSRPVFLIGDGLNRFQFTDVRDLCDVILKFLSVGRGGLYNVGCDTKSSVNDLLTALISHSGGRSKLVSLPATPIKLLLRTINKFGFSPLMEEQFNIADLDFVLDTSKVRVELDWCPKFSDLDCLINAYDWWVRERKYDQRQFAGVFGLIGRFKSSHQSGFQKE
jgi:nucleoside-diphosphate-sugar epimerase